MSNIIEYVEFQDIAKNELLEKTKSALKFGEKKILFTAPVGSGKTIISGTYMDKFIEEEIRFGREKYAFLWISPGKGDLLNQSKNSISSFVEHAKVKVLSDVLSEGEIKANSITFMNWESIRSDDNIARRGGEKPSLDMAIMNSNLNIIALIDEAHESIGADKTEEVLQMLNPVLSIYITATPKNSIGFSKTNTVSVDLRNVIEEGIVKKGVFINKDLTDNSKDAILDKAIEKRDQIEKELKLFKRDVDLKPLVLIQISNDSSNTIKDNKNELTNAEYIKKLLHKKGISNDLIGIWLSEPENCQNIDDIKNSDIEFLIFKQAIATGWDCPRAHILVRFRETKSTIFDVQTIGRILRTVERKHYANDLIDFAYIYTEYDDLEYKLEVDPALDEKIVDESNRAILKKEFRDKSNFNIPMYKIDKTANNEVSAEDVVTGVIEALANNMRYFNIDSKSLKKSIITGKAHTKDLFDETGFLKKEKTIIVDKNEDDIKNEYNESILKLYSKYDLRSTIMKQLLNHKDVKDPLDARKLYLSNKEQINGLINDVILKYEQSVKQSILQQRIYTVPYETYYKNSKESSEQYVYTKMPKLEVEYTNSASEKLMEDYLSKEPSVKWWFKNEVHGENFSIAYTYLDNNELFNSLYYPDFFIITNDKKLIIIDVKASDKSEDYPYVEEKYNAGKVYECEVNSEINKGKIKNIDKIIVTMVKFKNKEPFVCINEKYTDDTNDPKSWVKLDTIL